MAYYRKRRTTRRRYGGRKRTWRRNFKRRATRYNRYGQKVQLFTRFVKLNPITGVNGTSETLAGYSFKLNELPSWGEFQNLYDMYKIKAVKVSFIPPSNVTQYLTVTDFRQTAFSNKMFSVIDYNDKSVSGLNVDSLRQYKTCKWSPGNRVHKRFIYVKPTTAIAEGSGSYGVATAGNPWVSMASNATEYFGLKVGITHPTLSADTQLYEIECKFYMCFKNVK